MILLDVPFSEKDHVKSLGAKWLPEQKKWAAISRSDYHKFIPWLCGINIFGGACEGSLDIACNNVFIAEGRQHCFKCGKETRVIGFAYDCVLQYEIEFIDAGEGSVSTEKNYDLNIMPPDENLPDYIIDIAKKNFNFDLTFSKTTESKYLANKCDHCNSLQGVSLEIGNFCTLSTLFNQFGYVSD
ncbi:DNA primase (plasmid) [Escherichia coli]|uniref:DUF5710 domain-containing protein n=1 Tax=Escherichia coli TaxID=562 RepID=UPI000772E8E7|nr:DUF5710 domain-containing protein [Escherichia coli]AUV34498.1 DNA primase [Escherichia coli]EFH8495204.1 DNA primase [Escherichia coli]EFJ5910539.1 DNA primase [Escherichia coli]EFJ8793275.1 DNA primase [Escherichia coli]EFL8808770.1 DNA primase [Escherichia coli]